MKTLILADGGVILAAADIVTDMGDRYAGAGAQYPKALAISLVEVGSLPDGFDPAYCIWDGEAVVCNLPAPSPGPVPEVISTRQFLIQLAASGIISEAEALAAARTGDVPTTIAAIFASLPSEQVSAAEITWARMTTVPRSDPLFVLAAGPPLNMTDAQIDDFFRAAAAIP